MRSPLVGMSSGSRRTSSPTCSPITWTSEGPYGGGDAQRSPGRSGRERQRGLGGLGVGAPAKRQVLSPRVRRRLVPYLFLVPATAAMLLIYFYPMLRGVFTSFLDYNTAIGTSEFSGLENYRDILRDETFWNSMQRSAIWVVGSVAGQFVVGFAFALLLNERWPGNRLVRALMLVPWVMPGVSVALGWRLIY